MQIKRSQLRPVVVAIDPALTANEDSDDTGIVVVGRGPHLPETCQLDPCPGHGYVLDDLTSHVIATKWAHIAVNAYDRWTANKVVAEVNNGADLVGLTVQAIRPTVAYEAVRATKSKLLRAEPAASLYQQGRVHHLGSFPELEAQMASWTPTQGTSPDRLDALVWGLTALKLIVPQGGLLIYSDEEFAEMVAANARLNGDEVLHPVAAKPGWQFGGDTSMRASVDDSDPTDDDEADQRGKVSRSPFV